VREPEAGEGGTEIGASSRQRVGVADLEGDAARIDPRARDAQSLGRGVDREHRPGDRGDDSGPPAGAARDLEHRLVAQRRGEPLLDLAQIGLPLGLGVDAVVLGGALRVVGPQAGVIVLHRAQPRAFSRRARSTRRSALR
jgi:hypothetical protein